MSTPMQRGFRILNRKARKAAAESVRYFRNATEISSDMPALFNSPEIDLIDENGLAMIGRKFIWAVKRSELIVNGQEDQPQTNDVIEWVWNGKTYSFTVQPELGATPSAGAADPRKDYWSVSTKLTDIT